MDKIDYKSLVEEIEGYRYLASCFTMEHQEDTRFALLTKAENLEMELKDLNPKEGE